MEIAYLHVVINHLPIMGVPLVLAVLLIGVWARSEPIKLTALLMFAGLGLATIAVFATGKGAEDFAEHLPGVSERAIDAHEDAATVAFVAVEALAAASLFLFLRGGGMALLRRRALAPTAGLGRTGTLLIVMAAAITTGLLGYAGKQGGRIAHTEFATGAGATEGEREGGESGRGRGRGRSRD